MNSILRALTITGAILLSFSAGAQYRTDLSPEEAATAQDTVVLTLDQALQIALSENISVQVADQEVRRQDYARKGTYASLISAPSRNR